jgi:hypothetical protein
MILALLDVKYLEESDITDKHMETRSCESQIMVPEVIEEQLLY